MKKKLLLLDFALQSLVLLPMLFSDILTAAGILTNTFALLTYMIYGLFLTTPASVAQLISSLIWVIRGDSRPQKLYLPVALVVAAFALYVFFDGQGIPDSLFWWLIILAKVIMAAYYVGTFMLWRKAGKESVA